MVNRFIFLLFLFLLMPVLVCICQPVIISSTGDWNDPAVWVANNIGDQLQESVAFDPATQKVVTVPSSTSYVVGSVSAGNNTLTIDGSLEIGQPGIPGDFITGDDAVINVTGTLIIWGKLVLGDRSTLIVDGSLVVKGTFNMGAFATLRVGNTGSMDLLTFNLGAVSAIENHGVVKVKWSVVVGSGSTVSNTGQITANSCLAPPGLCPIILPVELIYFEGIAQEKRIVLKWATASEKNSDVFIVQRSLDAKGFESIGTIPGHGNSVAQNEYSFIDVKPCSGKMYYRLAMADLDGGVDYSDVIVIAFEGKGIRVYPNPVSNGRLHIDLNFTPEQPCMIYVADVYGVVIKNFQIRAQSAEFDVSFLTSGVYLLIVESPLDRKTVRLVVP